MEQDSSEQFLVNLLLTTSYGPFGQNFGKQLVQVIRRRLTHGRPVHAYQAWDAIVKPALAPQRRRISRSFAVGIRLALPRTWQITRAALRTSTVNT